MMKSPTVAKRTVPWSQPLIGEAEQEAAIRVIRSGWMAQGKETAAFEEEIAQICEAKHAVVVNNGTSALITALLASGIGKGDEVLVPTFTFIATVNAVMAVGAQPVLVDCDPQTFNVTADLLKSKITRKTKAILFVDVYGMPCDIESIQDLAKLYDLTLIEDAAEAIGARYRGRPVGSYPHLTVLSFHMAKLVSTVEGGAVLTGDDQLASSLRQIRNQGQGGKYHYVTLGYNFRMTDIQAAIGREQLRRLPAILEHRQRLINEYKVGLEGFVQFQEIPEDVNVHPHMIFAVLLRDRKMRDRVNRYLNDHGIDTRICWVPAQEQPYHREIFLPQGTFPASETIAERNLSLPLGNALTREDVQYVVQIFREAMEGK